MNQQTNTCQANSGGPVNPAHIGRQIRAARKARGMTQWELARAIGCSQTIISHLEAGYTLATWRWLPAAVAAVGLKGEGQ